MASNPGNAWSQLRRCDWSYVQDRNGQQAFGIFQLAERRNLPTTERSPTPRIGPLFSHHRCILLVRENTLPRHKRCRSRSQQNTLGMLTINRSVRGCSIFSRTMTNDLFGTENTTPVSPGNDNPNIRLGRGTLCPFRAGNRQSERNNDARSPLSKQLPRKIVSYLKQWSWLNT